MNRPAQSVSAFAGVAVLGAALIWSYASLTKLSCLKFLAGCRGTFRYPAWISAFSRFRRCRQSCNAGGRQHHHECRRTSV